MSIDTIKMCQHLWINQVLRKALMCIVSHGEVSRELTKVYLNYKKRLENRFTLIWQFWVLFKQYYSHY